mmetsp:Transcript_10808/g.66751  ORF Transcript_10808/g.66751 Transcript_10808/m.66751 type:complete len:720 (-) Transcript_10808:375-2534(-)
MPSSTVRATGQQAFLMDPQRRSLTLTEVYELVQQAGHIVPRMYLICLVGCVLIKSKAETTKSILTELVEMTRGVQHPVRGLFVRSYLAQQSKDKLPDHVKTGEDGSVEDAIDFVIQNFTEMNKLWVRMQHQSMPGGPGRNEIERKQLRDLVGKNLVLLSQLESVDLPLYQKSILPKLLEQIINCKDDIAQQYLMDCVIQVFPDEFHLHSLDALLDAFAQLSPTVNLRLIMSGLMNRLAEFASEDATGLQEFESVDAFNKLSSSVSNILSSRQDLPVLDGVSLFVSLVKFAVSVYPEDVAYAKAVLDSAAAAYGGRGQISERKAVSQVQTLLSTPLEQYEAVVLLSFPSYEQLLGCLEFPARHAVAISTLKQMLKKESKMANTQDVERVLTFLKPLIVGEENEVTLDEDFSEEQTLVSAVVHLIECPDPDEQFQCIAVVKDHFQQGGIDRMKLTFPSLVFAGLKLVGTLQSRGEGLGEGKQLKILFRFLYETALTVGHLSTTNAAINCFLGCAKAADGCKEADLSYEFYTEAFMHYEEHLGTTKKQSDALQIIIGTLRDSDNLPKEDWDRLAKKVVSYSSNFLRKQDQCRAHYRCAHLFWKVGLREEDDQVLHCLERALKAVQAIRKMSDITHQKVGPVALLYVEVLDAHIYHHLAGNRAVTLEIIQEILDAATEEVVKEEVSDSSIDVRAYFERTKKQLEGIASPLTNNGPTTAGSFSA